MPDLKVTAEEMALRRRARDVLKAAASAGGEQVNVDRRSTEPPELQYVFGQYVSLHVRTEDAGLKQVHPEQPRRYRVWKWRPLKEGEPAGEYLLLDDVENAIGSATADLLCPITDLVPKTPKSELARMVSWEDLPGWSITGVRQLWKDVNRVADGKARIQQLKFVTDDTMHRELREKDGHSYVNFWAFLRERAGESQGGSMIGELQRAPMDFNGDPGEFQAALDIRMDIERRAPWQTKLASDLLMALSAEKLQTMRAGPVKQAMQQMMATAERAFTDGDDGVTHEAIIRQVHGELGAIYRGQVARDALAELQAAGTEPPKRSARWAKPTEEEEKPKPKPPTGGGDGSGRGGRGIGRGGRGGARGGAGRGSGGERDPMTKRVCSYEAVQKGSCPFKEDCRFAHERNDEERAAMRRSRTNPTEMTAHKERVKAAKEQRSAKTAAQVPEEEEQVDGGRRATLAGRPIGKDEDVEFEYELPDDDDGPVVEHRRARFALMAGARANEAASSTQGLKVVTMLSSLDGAPDIVTYGFRPADELDEPSPRYAPTDEDTSGHDGDAETDSLSTMTPTSMSDIKEPDEAGTGPDTGSDDGCAKCQEARSLTIADQQAVVTHGMTPKPAHEHCHRCDAVARADEPGICPACALPLTGRPIGKDEDVEFEYELPDDGDGPVVEQEVRFALMAGQGSDDGTDTPPIEEMHGVAAVDGYYGYHSPTEHSTVKAGETQNDGSAGSTGVPVTGMLDDSGASFHVWDVDTLQALGSTEVPVPGMLDASGSSFHVSSEESMHDGGDGTTGVLVGSTTGGVTASEMRRADLTFMAQMQAPWRAEQAVDTRLRDILELRETHPATFVHVMSLFEERDASIRDLDQQIAERRQQITELQHQAGTSDVATVSEPDELAEAPGTDSIYQLDLTTMQLQELEVEATEANIMAAAEQLAGAMFLGAGVFETEQQRDAALDAVQVEMLSIANALDARYDVDQVRHEDVPAGYEASTPAVVEHELPDDGDTGVHRHALMVLSKPPDAKEAPTEEPADNTMGALDKCRRWSALPTITNSTYQMCRMQRTRHPRGWKALDAASWRKRTSRVRSKCRAATRREKEVEHLVTLGCGRDEATAALLKYNDVDEALAACIEAKQARSDACGARTHSRSGDHPEVEMTEAVDTAATTGQDTVTACSDAAKTAAGDTQAVVDLISPASAGSADGGATETVEATGTPGDGKDDVMASPEPADATTSAGGSSGQEGAKVSGTVAQPKPAGAPTGTNTPAGSAAIKPEGPKTQLDAVRQLIRKAEEILLRPEEKNKNEYGQMYDWLSKAMHRLLPSEVDWKADDPQSARLCLSKLKSVEVQLSDSGAGKRGRSPKDEGVGTKARRIMTLHELLEQIGLYDAECRGGKLLRDVLQDDEIETVEAFRQLSKDDLCKDMGVKKGQWQKIEGWRNDESGPGATAAEAKQGEPGAVKVEPVGKTAVATKTARTTSTPGAGGKTDKMFEVLMDTGVNKVLPDIGQLYGGDLKMDVALNGAFSEQEVQTMFGQRLALGARQQFEIKLTDLSYLKKAAKDPDPGMEVDLTFGISPDSEMFRPLVREAAATFDCMKGVQDLWASKVRKAESKAVAAVESAEGSAEAKREANTGTTATLQGRLTKAQQALKKATENVDAIEKELGEQRKQPEKIDSDLTAARAKACTKLHEAVAKADRAFQRTAYRFFYAHKMVTNGDREGLIHRLTEGDNPVLTPEAAKLVLDKLPDSDTASEANAEDEESDSDNVPLSSVKGRRATGGKAAAAAKAAQKPEAAPKGEKKQQRRQTTTASGSARLATRAFSNPPGESTMDQVAKLIACGVKRRRKYQEADADSKRANWEELTKVVWSTERELLAFVKLWRTACLSRKMSTTKTSDRWAVRDQLTSDLIINMCSELEWVFTAGKPPANRSTGEAVDYQYEYDPAILSGSPEHIETRMRQHGGPGESYESRVQAWCRRLGEDLKTGSILTHFELAQRIHAVDGEPWVKSQPPSDEQRQSWRAGEGRWVLPTLTDGEPCSAGILAALAGEEEGEYLADHVSDKRVFDTDEAGNELYEYLVHYSGYSGEPEWSRTVSQILIDNYNVSEAEKTARRRLDDLGWLASPVATSTSTPSPGAASAAPAVTTTAASPASAPSATVVPGGEAELSMRSGSRTSSSI